MNFIRPRWRRRTLLHFFIRLIFSPQVILWREDYVSHLEMGGQRPIAPRSRKGEQLRFSSKYSTSCKNSGTHPCVRSNIFLVFFMFWGSQPKSCNRTQNSSLLLLHPYYATTTSLRNTTHLHSKKGETSAAPLACAQR